MQRAGGALHDFKCEVLHPCDQVLQGRPAPRAGGQGDILKPQASPSDLRKSAGWVCQLAWCWGIDASYGTAMRCRNASSRAACATLTCCRGCRSHDKQLLMVAARQAAEQLGCRDVARKRRVPRWQLNQARVPLQSVSACCCQVRIRRWTERKRTALTCEAAQACGGAGDHVVNRHQRKNIVQTHSTHMQSRAGW